MHYFLRNNFFDRLAPPENPGAHLVRHSRRKPCIVSMNRSGAKQSGGQRGALSPVPRASLAGTPSGRAEPAAGTKAPPRVRSPDPLRFFSGEGTHPGRRHSRHRRTPPFGGRAPSHGFTSCLDVPAQRVRRVGWRIWPDADPSRLTAETAPVTRRETANSRLPSHRPDAGSRPVRGSRREYSVSRRKTRSVRRPEERAAPGGPKRRPWHIL